MSAVPAIPRAVRSSPRGRRQVRLAADDLAEIIELALASPGPSTVATLEQIAGHDSDGASEVIARILARTRPTPRRAAAGRGPRRGIRIEGVVPAGLRPLGGADAPARADGTISVVGDPGTGKSTLIRWTAHRRARPLATVDLDGDEAVDQLVDGVRHEVGPGMTVALLNAHGREPSAVASLLAAIPRGCLTLVETTVPDAVPPTDHIITVELPSVDAIAELLHTEVDGLDPREAQILAALSLGETPRALVRGIERARRFAATTTVPGARALRTVTQERFAALPPARRRAAAEALLRDGQLSQRAVSELTGVSRDTLRRCAV
ncbi:hypothetical protein [Microbacterium sp. BH-3-3-3]|uniref:hypothetical protein n=1 Tax=Microbacterium sp. BH-3-3-3 TaxID=1906742 RepID=UPI0011A22720|nr:hypothetical protein [Microbacterium sp. BH-3-3-3]